MSDMVRRTVVRVTVTMLASFALLTAGAQAASGRIAWNTCYGEFQCGQLNVPLDYRVPQGTTIALSLIRLPATDPAHRIGSLLINPGGPGGSGVDYLVNVGPELFTPEVRARFDLVSFDPRGLGRSTALRCFGTMRESFSTFPPYVFPRTAEEVTDWATYDGRLVDACDQRGGRIADHMATAEVARDMDRMRAAVGDERLTYAGISYGSYVGLTYANLFPDHVRAVMIDGILDPIAWSTGRGDEASTLPFSSREGSIESSQATLEEFFRLCDAAGDGCAFSGGAAARYAALAQTISDHPVPVTFPDGSQDTIDYGLFIGLTLGGMYDSLGWPDFATLLAAIEQGAGARELGARAQQFRFRPAYLPKRVFPHYVNFAETFPAIACADSNNPAGYDAWFDAGIAADAHSYFGSIWTWASAICASWDRGDTDRYMGPWDRTTHNPLLVIGNTSDPATPYANAQTVAGLMPGAVLLTVHAWGHTSQFLSACADAAITRYLVDLTTPAPGTVCEQDHVPFGP